MTTCASHQYEGVCISIRRIGNLTLYAQNEKAITIHAKAYEGLFTSHLHTWTPERQNECLLRLRNFSTKWPALVDTAVGNRLNVGKLTTATLLSRCSLENLLNPRRRIVTIISTCFVPLGRQKEHAHAEWHQHILRNASLRQEKREEANQTKAAQTKGKAEDPRDKAEVCSLLEQLPTKARYRRR